MVIRLSRRGRRESPGKDGAAAVEAARARFLIEESREIVLVLDEKRRLIAASRRARQSLPGLEPGQEVPPELLREEAGRIVVQIPYEVDGHAESLVYIGRPGDLAAYQELRAGFTAAVSHELRTPLARLLALLDSALLPGADLESLLEQARREVQQAGELIDDVLFLSELESGRVVVSLGSTRALGVLERVVSKLGPSAERAGVSLVLDCPATIDLPLRERMLETVVENLATNAIRYAGEGATFTLSVRPEQGWLVLSGADDGVGVPEEALPRLFERFYRGDASRTSRGTGLGLAIVKHVVTAAGGRVEALGGSGRGLEIRCLFPAGSAGVHRLFTSL